MLQACAGQQIVATPIASETLSASNMGATATSLPTNPPERNPEYVIKELVKNNGGCEFPCFWGIVPGETTWESAQQFLETFSDVNYRSGEFLGLQEFGVLLPVPKKNALDRGSELGFRINKLGTIIRIHIPHPDKIGIPNTSFRGLLGTFGPPKEIYIDFERGTSHVPPMIYYLIYYPDHGLITYSIVTAQIEETVESSGAISINVTDDYCLEEISVGPELWLWAPEYDFEIDEILQDNVLYPSYYSTRDYLPISEASALDSKDLYDQIFETEGSSCIEIDPTAWDN